MPHNTPETAGRFRVWLITEEKTENGVEIRNELVWDRKTMGGFPELKDLVSSLILRSESIFTHMLLDTETTD